MNTFSNLDTTSAIHEVVSMEAKAPDAALEAAQYDQQVLATLLTSIAVAGLFLRHVLKPNPNI